MSGGKVISKIPTLGKISFHLPKNIPTALAKEGANNGWSLFWNEA